MNKSFLLHIHYTHLNVYWNDKSSRDFHGIGQSSGISPIRIKSTPHPFPEVLPPTALLMHHCLLHLESPPAVSRSDTNPLITSIIRSRVPERSSGDWVWGGLSHKKRIASLFQGE
ncbi:hypothetical protein CDAR_183841 [Caerostris darwini]|uniref:Ycf15 n=1 Tax=Caerostris darwini TaxID=1538125 RepID=A0AAV4TXY4_9ARAC|nr:hypothetical protein CDAR_183841 [Caerostris darwini]